MSDEEFATYLRSLPREVSVDEADELERLRDVDRGLWHNPNEVPCYFGGAAH